MKIYQKIILVSMMIISILGESILGSSYIYNIDKKVSNSYIVDQSSISTSAPTPEFKFESVSQVLMEPKSGKIIYANNEDQKLLPASVTKVMTY